MADITAVATPRLPKLGRPPVIVTFAVVALALWLWAGAHSHFVPTPLGRDIAISFGLAAGWLGGFWAVRRAHADPRATEPTWTAWLTRHATVKGPLTALAVGAVAFVAFDTVIAAWYTDMTGADGARAATVAAWAPPTRQQCGHFNLAEMPFVMSGAVCATQADADEIANGARLTLVGRASPLGINVQSYKAPRVAPLED